MGAYGLLPLFGLVDSKTKPNSSKITQYDTTATKMILKAIAACAVVPGRPHHVNLRREMTWPAATVKEGGGVEGEGVGG